MGRRPLPPGEARNEILQLRVNEAERATLEAAAAKKGQTFGEWARTTLLALARRARKARS